MELQKDAQNFLFKWRGQNLNVEMNPEATLKDLGDKLQKLTNVKSDTLRLLVAMEKSSKLLYPFSNDHSCLRLDEASIIEGKPIRMMGVPADEVDEFLKNEKTNLRIAGFDEEDKRLRQRNMGRTYTSRKLPEGTYVFSEFRTLTIPGIELSPPASKALELLHKLASDPGIVAIMNKYRWRVGLLTEMEPIGYVGVSPKCLLGVNKNRGEEISLRLRTDDLKGFRKYESIKKTLLHELAHMVFSEHDADFYALDKQLNREATTLDWTKSNGHTLSGFTHSQYYDEDIITNTGESSSQKLGGQTPVLPNARASSVFAAFQRFANTSAVLPRSSEELTAEPNPRVSGDEQKSFEPDPDNSESDKSIAVEPYDELEQGQTEMDLDPVNIQMNDNMPASSAGRCSESSAEDSGPNLYEHVQTDIRFLKAELDDSGSDPNHLFLNKLEETNSHIPKTTEISDNVTSVPNEPNPEDSQAELKRTEPDPDDKELQIIQDPVTLVCARMQNAIQLLKSEVNPSDAEIAIQTLIKILRNVIEHPQDLKFRKLRKANPVLQKNILRYKAVMDILALIGFSEDVIMDESGKSENFLVLKRDDPGLLWLAKSSLETSVAL